MTTTDKPSIAELRASAQYATAGDRDHAVEVITAAPVLLEIAQAALELAGPSRPSEAHLPAWNALLAATAKVRP